MSNAEHEAIHRDVGAYLLGALEPAERDQFERHLVGCAQCRNEVADLAVLPPLLSRLDDPPPAPRLSFEPILSRLVAQRRAQRRRQRLLTGVAAVVAALAAVTVLVGPPQGAEAPDVASGAVYASADGAVTATVQARPWGMAVHIAAADLPASNGYVARAVARDGHTTQVASWNDTGGAVNVSGACYLAARDVARVEILDPRDDEVLVVLSSAP